MRVFVHIADVSAYLPSGVPLDYGAAERAFSTYVPGNVAPMLPPELSEDACSLRPHQDRLCVTTEVLLDGDFRRGEPRFYRSLIRSDARLAYGQAERILSGEERAAARARGRPGARRPGLVGAPAPAFCPRRPAHRAPRAGVRLRRRGRRRARLVPDRAAAPTP